MKSERLKKSQEVMKQAGPCISDVCSWGGLSNNGKVYQHYKAICLAALNYSGEKYDTLWHLHRPRCDKDLALAWLKAILCKKTSPYRTFLKAQEPQSIKDVLDHGFVMTNLDFPANLVVNFMMAFRVSQEYPQMTELWKKLHDDGIQTGTVLNVLGFVPYYTGKTGNIKFQSMSKGHWPTNWEYQDDAPHLMNAGTPDEKYLSRNKFKDSSSYTPCNQIWGSNPNSCVGYRIMKFVSDYKQDAKKGRFANPQAHVENVYTYGGILALCRAIEKKEFK